VKIVDFGIARDASTKKRLTVAGMVMGTPEYMAPEQASGQETDHRADQYALGCILYEMITGQVPFRGENPMQTLTKHVFDVVVLPSKLRPDLTVPASLEAVIMKTLAKKRDDRYADLEALMPALAALEPELRNVRVPSGAEDRNLRPAHDNVPSASLSSLDLGVPRRRPAVFVAVAASAVVLAGVLALRPHASPVSPVPVPVAVKVEPVPPRPSKPATDDLPGAAKLAASVEVTITSSPPGADVLVKDELVGVTPVKVTRSHSETERVAFVLRKAGYKETTREVLASKDAYVEVLLVRDPTGSKKTTSDPVRHPVAPVGTRPIADAGGKTTSPTAGTTKPSQPTPPKHTSTELRNPFDDPKP